MAENKRRGGGSKLARTETVQVRLDPKLRFAAELAAAKERRTLSSFVEWAVERAVREVSVTKDEKDVPLSAAFIAQEVWDPNEVDCFCTLAMSYPELLTHDEQRKWRFISEYPDDFWMPLALSLKEWRKRVLDPYELSELATKIGKSFPYDSINIEPPSEITVSLTPNEVRELRSRLLSEVRTTPDRKLLRAAWHLISEHINEDKPFDWDRLAAVRAELRSLNEKRRENNGS